MNESRRELWERIETLRRNIPCTCRNCGKKYTYMEGFSMRYCSEECYVAKHTSSSYDHRTHRMNGMEPTYEERIASIYYYVSMRMVYKLLEKDLITLEEYYRISFKQAEKIVPDEGTLFSDVLGEEWN